MIHPQTVVRTVSPEIGNGVFALGFIPRGTIVVVRDDFDFSFSASEFSRLPKIVQQEMETYMYRDRHGHLVLGWDHARYMNHNCNSNTLMTDYGLEIAIRDIEAGEEITTDYGLLNVIEPYPIFCGCDNCRQHLQLDDIDRFADKWDKMIEQSLRLVPSVDQPLLPVMPAASQRRLAGLLEEGSDYSSVINLKWRPGVSRGDRSPVMMTYVDSQS